jgi:hypothetical protein
VGERHLGDLARDVRVFCTPVAKGRPKAVRHAVGTDSPTDAELRISAIVDAGFSVIADGVLA